jgi:probable biosynthetic protein (TIGR04098 family)
MNAHSPLAPVRSIASARASVPETPRRVRVGMPHLDAGGLSENWLLRHAGDLHWEAIGRRLGVSSDELRGAAGERLYPTFVAVRARYAPSLAAVRENNVLAADVDVAPCGRACAHGRITVRAAGDPGFRADLELLSTFAVPEGPGMLRMALPAPHLAARWVPPPIDPQLARLARAARRGAPLDDQFSGAALAAARPPLAELRHEPSPYTDYNGAGLLYFAAYVTIAETAERQLVRRRGRPAEVDRALALSPVRRDVFYYTNLPLGDALTVELCDHVVTAGGVRTHLRLRRASDGQRMADVVTQKVARR